MDTSASPARAATPGRPRALRAWLTLAGVLVALLLAVALRLVIGPGGFGLPVDPGIAAQVWELRAQRAISGIVVGAALGAAGVLLQSLLRNPLASPDLMGLAAGAGLGVMAAQYAAFLAGAGLVVWTGNGPPALLGALGALALVYALSQRRGLIDPVSMVLVGVIVSILCGAGTLLLQSLQPDRGQSAARWLLGGLSDDTAWSQIVGVGVITVAGTAVGAFAGRSMDAAALSEDEARTVGVRLGALRMGQFLGAGVLTAGSVVLAGPIGFVGLVCPHLVRMLAGPGHRVLMVGSAGAGAALVVLADCAVAVIDLGAGRLPIGVLTALLGGPVFLYLLRRQTASR